jgi:ubiquinone/menaquinone biosynthesis C-methylase UbiE
LTAREDFRIKEYFMSRGTVANWWDLESKTPEESRAFQQGVSKVMFGLDVKGKSVLDAGAGRGRFAFAYGKMGASLVVLCDLSLDMLESAERRPPASEADFEFVQSDIELLCFREGAFDVVSCLSTLTHLPSPDRALGKLYDALRLGGGGVVDINLSTKTGDSRSVGEGFHALLSDSNLDRLVNGWGPNQLRTAIRASGFRILRESTWKSAPGLGVNMFFVGKPESTGERH